MIPKERLDKLRAFAENRAQKGEDISISGGGTVSASFLVLLIDERNHFSNALTFLEWHLPGGVACVARALSETTHDSIGSQRV